AQARQPLPVRARGGASAVDTLKERRLSDLAQRDVPGGQSERDSGRRPHVGGERLEQLRLRTLALGTAGILLLRNLAIGLDEPVELCRVLAPASHPKRSLIAAVVAVPGEEVLHIHPPSGDLPQVGGDLDLLHFAVAGRKARLEALAPGLLA